MPFMPMDQSNPLYALLNPGMGVGGLANRGPSWLPSNAGFGNPGVSQQQPGLRGLLSNPDFALALLANSGGPQKKSFGEVFGQAGLQANQIGQQRQDDEFMRQYRQAQLEQLKNKQQASPWGAVQPDKFTPESLKKFEQTGKYSDLELRQIGTQYGRYNPGDFTPASWAEFMRTQDPSTLVRYVAPAQPVIKDVNGVPTAVMPDRAGGGPPRQNPLSTLETEAQAAARLAREKAAGTAAGEAQGAQDAKAPAKASFDKALENLRGSIKTTQQGMVSGPLGTVFDYGDKKLFQSRVQQLSTELRTVYRIPGEGTLSDQEQKQYGLQLPSTDFPPDVNEQILKDLEERTKLRTGTSIGGAGASGGEGGQPRRRKYNPATGQIE